MKCKICGGDCGLVHKEKEVAGNLPLGASQKLKRPGGDPVPDEIRKSGASERRGRGRPRIFRSDADRIKEWRIKNRERYNESMRKLRRDKG
jgi:hypothetical protein